MIAVDLGQFGCRIQAGADIFISTRGLAAGELAHHALDTNFRVHALKAEIVALSLSGLYGDVGDVTPYLKLCHDHFGATEVVVIDDGLANLAGALAGQPGVALTLGGGVVAVGGNGRKLSHADGLGSIFGDEGGGVWLGSRGLARALATRDGRDQSHELVQIFKDQMTSFDQLASKTGPDATLLAISSAQPLLEAADAGISEALRIRSEGAKALACSVVAAWEKVGDLNDSFKVTISGGLAKNMNYRSEIFQEIIKLAPQAELVESVGDNLSGAIWIAENLKEDLRPMMAWARY